ncbi:MAG TPA: phosphotransferase [Alphaproteobacteria bacterium]|nr:phosphotransferase [Alphaproteobacteria bacterium]
MSELPPELLPLLRRAGLLAPGEALHATALAGGVASDIWRLDLAGGAICVKRALPKLKVEAEWRAPVERNAYEVAWLQLAGRIAPGAVPKVLAHDSAAGLFVMEFLDPALYPVWKSELREGRVDLAAAREVGARLARIHAGTAGDAAVAESFRSDEIFYAIRLEPYLEAAARAHRTLADPLRRLLCVTAATRRALVHGDVSPKNILLGPRGPIFLDAECAWYGDPAFDLAFCLNHLLLKCLLTPPATTAFLRAFEVLVDAYLAGVSWESPPELEARAAHLLPGLFLARVDGKSPVEYLVDERDKAKVRRVAGRFLRTPVETLREIARIWATEAA